MLHTPDSTNIQINNVLVNQKHDEIHLHVYQSGFVTLWFVVDTVSYCIKRINGGYDFITKQKFTILEVL